MLFDNLINICLYFVIIMQMFVNTALLETSSPTCQKMVTKKSHIHTAAEFNKTMNVRTVLFTGMDTCKVCWSPEEVNLLVARRLMQDLIPKRIPRDFAALLEYINTCIGVVKTKTTGKVTQTMMMAIYDAIGGYLHSVVMPILNEAYYAGNVDYSTTSQLHYLLSMMMTYLGTNGASWSNPCDMSKIPTKVSSLPIRMCAQEEACKYFVLLTHKHSIAGEKLDANNETIDHCSSGELKIQIPFLDDNSYPSAMAVPFKDHALFSLMSECSVNIIPKFYILAMRCLGSSRYTTRDIVNFNHRLHHWIISTVVPHLQELDRWYPGFGGVMRVVETMNKRGLANTEPIKPEVKAPNLNFSSCLGQETCGISLDGLKDGSRSLCIWILLILLALLLLLLFCCCLRCICVRFFKKKSNEDEVNTLVSLYCGLREPSNQDEEKTKVRTSGSKTYASVSSFSASSSPEGSE